MAEKAKAKKRTTPRRKPTETSSFGVSGRQSHNSAKYYARALGHAEVSDDATVVRPKAEVLDQLYCHSSEKMRELPAHSVALMVTSPEYHVGKAYEDANESIADYLALLHRVLKETYRVLEPGGRAAINVANLGRKPYVQLADIVAGIATNIGFLARGEIIWVKGEGASGNIAVGSFASPSAPCLRDVHEYVMVFSKGRWERAIHWKQRKARDLPWEATISKEDFLAWTLSIWRIQPESAKRVGHPAPFPVELPRRLIELYTWADDVVLDPFMGAGATAVAAVKTGRRYVGYDIDQGYLDRAQKRIDEARGDGQA